MSINSIFLLLLFFLTFFILNISVGVFLVHDNSIHSLLYFLVMQVINIGVAYGIAELFLSITVKRNNLSKMDRFS